MPRDLYGYDTETGLDENGKTIEENDRGGNRLVLGGLFVVAVFVLMLVAIAVDVTIEHWGR